MILSESCICKAEAPCDQYNMSLEQSHVTKGGVGMIILEKLALCKEQ
jgi:hypothetical protein